MRKLRAISLLPLLLLCISLVPDQYLCHYPMLVCSWLHCGWSRIYDRGVFIHSALVWFGFTPSCSPASDLSLSLPLQKELHWWSYHLSLYYAFITSCFHYILPSFLLVFRKNSNYLVYVKPASMFIPLFLPLWKFPEQDPHLCCSRSIFRM